MVAKSFHIATGTFTLRLWPTLITVILVAAMIGLGCWQIQRLHWKEGLIAEIEDRIHQQPIDVGLSVIPPDDIKKMDYHPGSAGGQFVNDKAMYLNATSVGNGKGGYDLMVPLDLGDGRYLLVDRGWLPYELKTNAPGDVPEKTVYRPAGTVYVTGIVRVPSETKPPMRPENDVGKNSWYWVDLKGMAAAAGVKEFLPFILEAKDAPHDGAWPVGGQTRVDLPNHHLNYALTWFWLAFILPVIYIASNWRKDRVQPVSSPLEGEDRKF